MKIKYIGNHSLQCLLQVLNLTLGPCFKVKCVCVWGGGGGGGGCQCTKKPYVTLFLRSAALQCEKNLQNIMGCESLASVDFDLRSLF